MQINPKITVITATFNADKTLENSIKSVLAQTYEHIEYILIDGYSTDNSVNIIRKYSPYFEGRMQWVSEKDGGIYDAWNKGIAKATGDWLMFVGADDFLTEDAVQIYVDKLKQSPDVNFISAKCRLVNEHGQTIRVYGKPWSNKINQYCVIAHVGSLHKSDLFIQNGKFDTTYKITGDYDFLLRCRNIIRPEFLDFIVANVQDGGISNHNILRIVKERRIVKLKNKSRSTLAADYDSLVTIIKFFIRTKLINPLMLKTRTYK